MMFKNLSRICAEDWAVLWAKPWRMTSVPDAVRAWRIAREEVLYHFPNGIWEPLMQESLFVDHFTIESVVVFNGEPDPHERIY